MTCCDNATCEACLYLSCVPQAPPVCTQASCLTLTNGLQILNLRPLKGTFVDDELALGAAELAQVQHGDVVVHAHGVVEGARMLHGCPGSQQTPV